MHQLDEPPTCRICYDQDVDAPLISPCACTGSVQYIHITCLYRWMSMHPHSKCEICKTPYNIDSVVQRLSMIRFFCIMILTATQLLIIASFVTLILYQVSKNWVSSLLMAYLFIGYSGWITPAIDEFSDVRLSLDALRPREPLFNPCLNIHLVVAVTAHSWYQGLVRCILYYYSRWKMIISAMGLCVGKSHEFEERILYYQISGFMHVLFVISLFFCLLGAFVQISSLMVHITRVNMSD